MLVAKSTTTRIAPIALNRFEEKKEKGCISIEDPSILMNINNIVKPKRFGGREANF